MGGTIDGMYPGGAYSAQLIVYKQVRLYLGGCRGAVPPSPNYTSWVWV
jgi:hypothetical protein